MKVASPLRTRTAYVQEIKAASPCSFTEDLEEMPLKLSARSSELWQLRESKVMQEDNDEKRPSVQFFKPTSMRVIPTCSNGYRTNVMQAFDGLVKGGANKWRLHERHTQTEKPVPWGIDASPGIEVSVTPPSEHIFTLDASPTCLRKCVAVDAESEVADAGADTAQATADCTPEQRRIIGTPEKQCTDGIPERCTDGAPGERLAPLETAIGQVSPPARPQNKDDGCTSSPISIMEGHSIWTPPPREFSPLQSDPSQQSDPQSDCRDAWAKREESPASIAQKSFARRRALAEKTPFAKWGREMKDPFESLAYTVYKLCGCL